MRCTFETKKARLLSLATALTACALTTAAPAQEAAEQADLPSPAELMERHIEAVGGADAIRKITSRKVTGTFSVPSMGMEGAATMYSAAPNKTLTIMDITGMGENVQGFNGKVGWATNQMTGPMLMEGETLAQAKRESEFYSDLKYTEMYETLETVGEVEYAGKEAYKVRQVADNGDESFNYFAKESGLLIGSETIASTPQGEIPVTVVLSDYKEFDGVKLATKTTINQMGMEVVITIDSVEINKVEDSVFETPEEIKALMEASDDGGDDDGTGDG